MNDWARLDNLRSTSASANCTPPWAMTGGTIPAGLTKQKFREWCSDANTKHCFWSPCTGINPALRVSTTNPCARRVAVVADYDSDSLPPEDQAGIEARIEKAVKKGAVLPGAWCRTFSGKVRAVWVLDKPLPGEPLVLHDKAMELLTARLGCRRILPGYDASAEEATQYFELGKDWVVTGAPPVPASLVSTCVFDAGKKLKLRGDSDVQIPLDEVAAEFERRWPGQWPGEFREGARGPLVWLEDGITREGCQIAEDGMICHSDRAGAGFLPWERILGKAFADSYRERKVSGLVDNVWYDGTRYWIKLDGGIWRPHAREDAALEIMAAGFSTERRKGQILSEVQQALLSIHRTRRIDGALPFLFDRNTIVDYQGERFLNISTRRVLQEAGGDGDPALWPWLNEWWWMMFDDTQRHVLFTRLKRAWEPARTGPMELGQMLIVAGDPSCGKSLLGMYVCRRMMGGGADASAYLIEGKSFNKQLCEVGVANVDDGVSGSTYQDHKRMTEMLKKHAANHEVPYRPMYRDTMIIPWRPLIVMTCNTDDWSLSILPSLDNNIRDKIIMLRANPVPRRFFPERAETEATINRELPHFLDWLLTYTPPDWLLHKADPRYGMNPYHHPSLVDATRASSPDHRFTEILDLWIEAMRSTDSELKVWEGTATALLASINTIEELRGVVGKYSPIQVGRVMGTIGEYYDPIEGCRMLRGSKQYAIRIRA